MSLPRQAPRRFGYHDLEKRWQPGEPYFGTGKVPRKLKKRAKALPLGWLDLGQRLWYLQGLLNPDLNAFLIKLVVQSEAT